MKNRPAITAAFLALALALGTVPAAAEEASEKTPAPAPAAVVNINTADASQLALLPRVGPALAQRILDFRQENGKFETPADLILVRGIGEKTFALLEPHVRVSGETTLKEKVRQSRPAVSGGSR